MKSQLLCYQKKKRIQCKESFSSSHSFTLCLFTEALCGLVLWSVIMMFADTPLRISVLAALKKIRHCSVVLCVGQISGCYQDLDIYIYIQAHFLLCCSSSCVYMGVPGDYRNGQTDLFAQPDVSGGSGGCGQSCGSLTQENLPRFVPRVSKQPQTTSKINVLYYILMTGESVNVMLNVSRVFAAVCLAEADLS